MTFGSESGWTDAEDRLAHRIVREIDEELGRNEEWTASYTHLTPEEARQELLAAAEKAK